MNNRRTLGLFDVTCLGLNCVIGSGIVLASGSIAAQLGSYAPLSFLLGGLLCTAIALCFAEMASMFGGTGGAYIYAREAFGPRPGFVVGFAMWLSGVIGGATVAAGFAENLGVGYNAAIISLTVLCLGAANYRGARLGAWTNNLLTVLKLVPLLGLAGWALISQPLAHLVWPPANQAPQWGGLLLIVYAFSGFEEISLPAGDVQDAERNVPLAILLVMLLSSVFYFVLQGLVGALGLAGSPHPLEDAARAVPSLQEAMVVGGLASLASINAAIAFTAPRSLWALAERGWLPARLRALHPRFSSPYLCVLVNSGLTWALAVSGTFERLVQLSVLISLVQYLATVLSVLKLRRDGRQAPLRVPLAVHLVALAVCLVLLGTSQRGDILGMVAALAVGAALAWARRDPV